MDAPNNGNDNGMITQQLEGFLFSARKLEDALGEERKRSQKIAQEYLATRTTLENAVRELQNRLIQRENKIQAIAQAFRNLQNSESLLRSELRDTGAREKKSAAELEQYRSAWNEVLAREAQARGAIIESEKAKQTLNEQRNQILALERKADDANQNAAAHSRHADTYQRELQSALIRIQSAEAKYSQIQKELSVLSQSKRNADEEIARIEASVKERFRWELATEKERLRAEIEKDAALDRERFREVARNQMRAEIDRQAAAEREAREAAESELARTREQLAETRNEIAMYQMESANAQARLENARKESNKAMLVERLQHDDEIRDLRSKIEQLVDRGIFAEKVEEAPAGIRVYSATPVELAIARSSRDGNVADHDEKSEDSSLL